MANIEDLYLPYPDFKLQEIIDPEQFDINNEYTVIKMNELLVVVNQLINSTTDGGSGADLINLTPITGFVSNKLQTFLEEVVSILQSSTGSSRIGTPTLAGLPGSTVAQQLASIKLQLVGHVHDDRYYTKQDTYARGEFALEKFNPTVETFIATEGQTVFFLTKGTYTRGKNHLEITVGGVEQTVGLYFGNSVLETGSTAFMLTEGVPAGTKIIAQYYAGDIPVQLGVGHGGSHEEGAYDELDVMKLRNYSVIDSRLSEISYNVKHYGVLGDGLSDDTAKIQSAINIVALNGGEVFFPKGTYLVSSRLEIPSNVSLRGLGKDNSKIVKREEHGNTEIFLIRTTASNVLIDGLHIDGASSDSNTVTTKGITLQGKDVTIINCHFENIKTYDAIYIGTSSIPSSNITIKDNTFDNIDRHAIAGIYSHNLSILSNTITNCGLYGIDLEPNDGLTQTNKGFLIENNIIDGTAEFGICITIKAENGIVRGNTIKNAGFDGLVIAHDVSNVYISNNTISDIGQSGIMVRNGSKQIHMLSNTIARVSQYGIRLGQNSTDVLSGLEIIQNNIIDVNGANSTYDYIRIEQSVTDCTVLSNHCSKVQGNNGNYGLNLLSVKNRIIGNTFNGFNASGVYNSSADNFISGNTEAGIVKKPIYLSNFRMDELGQVQQENWSSITLLNGWLSFGAPYSVPRYYKNKFGEVCIDGVIKNGTVVDGTVLFTLPVGYRPANDITFALPSNSSGVLYIYKLIIKSTGDVTVRFLQTSTEVSISIPPFRSL